MHEDFSQCLMTMYTQASKVIAVTARRLCQIPLEQQVKRIADEGISRIILREKDLPLDDYASLAKRVLCACKECSVTLIIHNYPEAARELGATRLHMPLNLLTKQLCEEFEVVGTSVHSVEDALKAYELGASYITAGHIFATDCKRGLKPRGLDFLREVCKAVDIPVYAIGGIDEDNIQSVLECGVAGACIMSEAMKL